MIIKILCFLGFFFCLAIGIEFVAARVADRKRKQEAERRYVAEGAIFVRAGAIMDDRQSVAPHIIRDPNLMRQVSGDED